MYFPKQPTPPPQLPEAIDLSHHLSAQAKARHPSPLKDILKYMYQDGMISLAGGLPHPSLFPYTSITTQVYPSDTFVDPVSCQPPQTTHAIHISKDGFPTATAPLNLTTSLQYGPCTGLNPLLSFVSNFASRTLSPAYSNPTILLNSGSTDGWSKLCALLLEKGDSVLVEEHTYPSAMACWIPRGVIGVPLAMDGAGITPEGLKEVMSGWKDKWGDRKRPNILYTVPVGQNPTGATAGSERKRQIYEICVEYDIIIVEDDPYYFLQYDDYIQNRPAAPCQNSQEYLDKLVPSYLSMDRQGRVIRLETFSKTLAPGCRLGYFISNPMFSERLLRATEVETQTPSGFSQAIVMHHLANWGQEGFITWLSNLCEQYRVRRDWLVEALAENFILIPATERPEMDIQGTLAYFKGSRTTGLPLFSFVCPTAGMFFWCRFYLTAHPEFQALKDEKVDDPEETLMTRLWMQLTEAKVLLTPGSYYHPYEGQLSLHSERGYGHLRLAFSVATKPNLSEAIARMEGALRRSWEA